MDEEVIKTEDSLHSCIMIQDDCEVVQVISNPKGSPNNISRARCLKKVCGRYCAVRNCRSDPKDTRFYGFPSKKIEQRLRWMEALKGISSSTDVICCNHFQKQKPSNKPTDVDYVPTLFDCYRKQSLKKGVKRAISSPITNGSHQDHSTNVNTPYVHIALEPGVVIPPSVPNDNIPSNLLISDPVTLKSGSLETEGDTTISSDEDILNNSLSDQVEPKEYFYSRILSSDHDCMSLCGVPSSVLYKVCGSIDEQHSMHLSKIKKVTIFFMKLRFNNPFTFIASLFGTNELAARETFISVTNSISVAFKNSVQWVTDKTPLNDPNPSIVNPEISKAKAMLQMIQMNIETPEGDDSETVPTMKYLIATTPSGIALFISKPYGGQFADTHIVLDSGLFDLLEENDLVFCGQGFTNLEQLLEGKNVILRRISDQEETLWAQLKRISRGVRQFEVLKILDNNLLPYMEVLIFCVAVMNNLILQLPSHTV